MTGLGSSCGACKFLRRKCTSECIFAPYFCYDQAATHFAAVHRVFGASNVSKLLLHLPIHTRSDAALSISYEALARMGDPIYGCVAHIFALQEQVANLQEEIEILGKQMANFGFGFTSPAGSSQVTTNGNTSNIGPQLSQSHNMNGNLDHPFHQNQQEPLLFHMGSTQANEVFNPDSVMDSQFPPFDGGGNEEQNPFFDYDPVLLDGLFEGVESEIFTCYPWLNNDGTNKVI